MPSTIISEFQNDEDYAPFLESNFDPKSHASKLVQGAIITEHLNKLSIGISKLEKEIESQVIDHYEDLLSNASGVDTLEDVLGAMHTRIQTLLAGVERLRARLVEPCNRIEQQTLMLGRLQMTCELLRRVLRCLSLSQRLEEQMANSPKDIAKAAASLKDLEDLGKDIDLTGINVLEDAHKMADQARLDVEKHASAMMEDGLNSQNQTQVGTALQVYYNLGILETFVRKAIDKAVKQLRKRASSVLNANAISQSVQDLRKGPGHALIAIPAQSAQFRANLWSGLELLMDGIHTTCLRVSHLYKVLSKKRDPFTHVCFLAVLCERSSEDFFITLWNRITAILTEEFSKSVSESNFIRQALEVDYPKLLRLFAQLCKKLHTLNNDVVNSRANASLCEESQFFSDVTSHFEPEKDLRNSISALEKAYMSRSLSRLFDSVNVMFSSPVVPTKDEIDILLRTITSELNVSSVDSHLSETIAKNVAKTIQLFCQKCEQLLVTGGEASQVIGTATEGQNLNVNVVNQLWYVHTQMDRMSSATLAHMPQAVLETLSSCLPSITALISAAIEPLFSSLTATIEAIILTMHQEDFSPADKSDAQCSLYMKELQSFVNRAVNDYVKGFHLSPLIKDRVNQLAGTSLQLFIRHASLVRPLGGGGKNRLAADFANMEITISPLTGRPSELGSSYRVFRALRPLLFETTESIASNASLGDVLPYSLVLNLLFSRAPREMRSPRETAGWSESRYSSWLDDHLQESERLELIEGALEAYLAGVKSRQQTEFAAIYPVMVDLLKKGLQKASK